jgi:hypothetical protein
VVDGLLIAARASGQTVIVASHEAPPPQLIDREVTMDGGRVIAPAGPPPATPPAAASPKPPAAAPVTRPAAPSAAPSATPS